MLRFLELPEDDPRTCGEDEPRLNRAVTTPG